MSHTVVDVIMLDRPSRVKRYSVISNSQLDEAHLLATATKIRRQISALHRAVTIEGSGAPSPPPRATAAPIVPECEAVRVDQVHRMMILPEQLSRLRNSHVATMLSGFVSGLLLERKSIGRFLHYARETFRVLPSCTEMHVPAEGRVTIVGDTHGQLPDLLHILSTQGWPSPSNRYIFNGA
eukprot:SAG11_NODE_2524_length_3260_cov_1.524518_3_plen_181_part_00